MPDGDFQLQKELSQKSAKKIEALSKGNELPNLYIRLKIAMYKYLIHEGKNKTNKKTL